MIEIGKNKIISWKDKRSGEIKTRLIKERVRRITRSAYGHSGRKRKLVVTLGADDLITIRPYKGTRAYSGNVWDIYYSLVNGAAVKVRMDKLRARRAKKAERLARNRLHSAERRFHQRLVLDGAADSVLGAE